MDRSFLLFISTTYKPIRISLHYVVVEANDGRLRANSRGVVKKCFPIIGKLVAEAVEDFE